MHYTKGVDGRDVKSGGADWELGPQWLYPQFLLLMLVLRIRLKIAIELRAIIKPLNKFS